MKIKNFVIILIIFIFNSIFVFSVDIYLEALRYFLMFDKNTPQSQKLVIKEDEIKNIRTIFDLLKFYNIDVYSRSDMQKDFSINGGGFEQIKILVDDIEINDPQTGHHNCNIPLNISDIEYIEVIKNDNFAKYGVGSFNGVIKIITKKKRDRNFMLSYGSFDTISIQGSSLIPEGFISFNLGSSNGYRPNTDYTYYNFYSYFKYRDIDFKFGFLNKDFGAQDFYTINKTEYEQTKTFFTNIQKKFNFKNINFDTNIFLKTNYDYYTTQRYNPQIYNNKHNSYFYGIKTKTNFRYNYFLDIQTGLDIFFKHLYSKGESTIYPNWSGMGKFFDYEFSLFYIFVFKKINFLSETAFRLNYFSRYNLLPQIGQRFFLNINPKTEFFLNISQVYRTPSYTELFYWDPNNQAYEKLKLEHSINYSLGINKMFDDFSKISFSFFYYPSSNVIDWLKQDSKWSITNITKAETFGFNVELNFNYYFINSKIFYSHIDKNFDLSENQQLKYLDNYPKDSISFLMFFPTFYNFQISFLNTYKKFTKTNSFILTNFILTKKFYNYLDLNLTIENLFDIKYEEIPEIKQPPRSIYIGININF